MCYNPDQHTVATQRFNEVVWIVPFQKCKTTTFWTQCFLVQQISLVLSQGTEIHMSRLLINLFTVIVWRNNWDKALAYIDIWWVKYSKKFPLDVCDCESERLGAICSSGSSSLNATSFQIVATNVCVSDSLIERKASSVANNSSLLNA